MKKLTTKVITKQTACIFLCMILAFSFTPQSGAEDAPQEVIQVAEQKLPRYLMLASHDMESFGFNEDDNLDDAVLGHPYLENYIHSTEVENYRIGDTIYDVITEGSMWYFPVMIGDETKCLMGVTKMGDTWKAVTFGGAAIAKRVGLARKVWPLSEGYDPLFITRYPDSFFSVPQVDEYNLTLLSYWPRIENEEELTLLYEDPRPLIETMAYIASQMSDTGDGEGGAGGGGGGEASVGGSGGDASWTGCFISTIH